MYREDGAVGFIEKDQATDQLLAAVRDVLAGRLFVPAATRDRLLGRASKPQRKGIIDPVKTLSPRETEFLSPSETGCPPIRRPTHWG